MIVAQVGAHNFSSISKIPFDILIFLSMCYCDTDNAIAPVFHFMIKYSNNIRS